MSARPRTQVWHLGTVPPHADDGEIFGRVRATALSGRSQRTTWLEWSAEPNSDLDDVAQWVLANPALGQRISVEAIETERASLPDDSFARERLAIWSVDRQEHLIPPAVWSGLVDARPVDGSFPTALAADRSNDGLMAIAGAWRDDDGRIYVRLLDL